MRCIRQDISVFCTYQLFVRSLNCREKGCLEGNCKESRRYKIFKILGCDSKIRQVSQFAPVMISLNLVSRFGLPFTNLLTCMFNEAQVSVARARVQDVGTFVPALFLTILTPFFFPFLFILFQSCCFHARMFGKTLVHEFYISYSHTEWYLLFPTAQPHVHMRRSRLDSLVGR